jgi:hypothetical protein
MLRINELQNLVGRFLLLRYSLYGGPIAEPADAEFVLNRTRGVAGFFGASSIERLPTEIAITRQVSKFKSLGSLQKNFANKSDRDQYDEHESSTMR